MVITTAVIKGGTGKTTTAAALAQAGRATRPRLKILAIDLDPQANLTYFLGADPKQSGSCEMLRGEKPNIQITPQKIHVISASPSLATEQTGKGSARRLRKALESLRNEYDLIIIDTPPQIGELTYNALMAADGLIIPLETDNSSLQGLYQITGIAHEVMKQNPDLEILGVILTRYDARPKLNRFYKETIEEQGSKLKTPLLATIRPGIAIREAQALQQSIYEYAPESNPAKDYKDLFKLIMKGAKKHGKEES